MSYLKALYSKITSENSDVLSDSTIPSTPAGCKMAIEAMQTQMKEQLENDAKEAVANADYKEVDRKKVGEREVGRRIVRTWVSGNTQYTEWEITNEETYEIQKKKELEKAQEAFKKKVEKLNGQLNAFTIKCQRKIAALEALRALTEAIKEQEKEAHSNWDSVEYFATLTSLILLLFPAYRFFQIAKRGLDFAKWIIRLGKFTKEEMPQLPKPSEPKLLPPKTEKPLLSGKEEQKGYQIYDAKTKNPLVKDRTIPENLTEQIAKGGLKNTKPSEVTVIATKDKIRDISRIENLWGKGNWEKCQFTLKNYADKSKPKVDAVIHFYKDEARKLIVEPKFKNLVAPPKSNPLEMLTKLPKK